MPARPRKPCRQAGCRELIAGGEHYCAAHTKAKQTNDTARRGTAAQRGYDSAWTKARGHYLRVHPLCVHCKRDGRVVAATVVDHIIAHRLKDALDSGDDATIAKARSLFWDSANNWQSLCKTHHDIKTATKDGGFGRARKGS
jgi:5-methylcytosine-specific restriction protein A